MSICKVGSNTKETVIENFKANVLISESPLTTLGEGDYLVLKPDEFDKANAELSTDLFQFYNLLGTLWVRTGSQARFNNVLSDLTDILAKRKAEGNEQFTNGYAPPIYPSGLRLDITVSDVEGVQYDPATVTITPNRKKVFDEMTDETTFYDGFRFDFPDGAEAFGFYKGNHAYLTRIQAPKDKKGTKTYERVVSELRKIGVSTLTVWNQSAASRTKLSKMVESGDLINPQDMIGVSTDLYPATFDFPSIQSPDLPTIEVPIGYKNPCT